MGSFTRAREAAQFLAAVLLGCIGIATANAQSYPSRPITMVLPGAPGSASDQVGRTLAKSVAAQTGTAVVADNKVGANGIIGVNAVMNASADGYTLLFTTLSTMALNKFLVKGLPYDPQADFIPLMVGWRSSAFILASPKSSIKSITDLIATAKREPGRLNFGFGTAFPQLGGNLLEQITGTRFLFVPYKTSSASYTALISGELDISIADYVSVGSFVKSGQMRPLASSAPKRLAEFPNVPTMRELGHDYELVAWHGLFVRRGTPPDVVAKLTELVKVAFRSPDLQAHLKSSGLDDLFLTGEEARAYMDKDIQRWAKVAHDAGVKPE